MPRAPGALGNNAGMGQNAGKVTLEAVAKTTKAENAFKRLKKIIGQLEKLIEGFSSGDIDFKVNGLDKVQAEVKEIRASISKIGTEPIRVDVKPAIKEIDRLKKQISSADDDLAVIELTADGEKVLEELRRVERKYEKQLRDLRNLSKRVDPFGTLSDAADSEAKKIAKAFEQGEKRFERSIRAYNRASKRLDFDETSRKARNLRENIRSAGLELIDLGQSAAPAARKIEGGFDRITRSADEARRAIDRMEDEIRDAGSAAPAISGLRKSMSDLVAVAKGFIAFELADRVRDFAASAITAARETELLIARLETVAGTTEGAEAEFAFLVETANTWGLSLQALTKDYAGFAAVLNKEGFTLEETRQLYIGLAVAARGAGLSQDDLTGAIRGLLQVAGKGAAQMDELRQQIGERFPGALQVLSAELGVTTEELFEMSEAGELLAGETIPKLVKALVSEFGEAATKAALGADAEFNRLETTVRLLTIEVGKRLAPIVLDAFSKILAAIENNKGAFEALFGIVESGFDVFVSVLQVVDGLLSGDIPKALKGVGSFSVTAVEISVKAFKTLAAVLGGMVEKLAEVAGALPGIGDEAEAALKKAAEGIERYENLLDRTIGELDRMRDGFQNAGDEGRVTGKKIRAEFEAIIGALTDLSNRSKKTGSLSKKDAEKAEKAWKGLGEAIRDVFSEDPSRQEIDAGPRTTSRRDTGFADQGRQVDDLRGKLEELRAERERLESQSTISDEDRNNVFDLTNKITELEHALRNMGDAAGHVDFSPITTEYEDEMDRLDATARDRGEKLAAILNEFVGSEEFEDSFKSLSAEVQAAVLDILARLQDLSAGGIDELGSLQFELENLAAAFEAGGQAPEGLADTIRAAMGGSGDSVDVLREKVERLGQSTAETGQKAEQAGGGTLTFGDKVIEVGKKSDEATENIITVGDEMISVGQKADEAAGGTIVFGERVVEVGDAASATSESVRDMAQAAVEAGAEVERAGEQSKSGAEGMSDAEKSARAVAEAIENVDKSSTDAATAMGDVAEQTRRISEAAKRAREESEAVAEGVQEVGDASKAAAPSLKETADASQSAATGLDNAKTAAKGVADALERTAAAQESDPLGAVNESAKQLAESGPALEQASSGFSAIAEALKKMAESAPTVQEGLGSTIETMITANSEGTVAQQGEQFGTLAEKLESAAASFEIIVTAIEAYIEGSTGVEQASETIRTAIESISDSGAAESLQELADETERLAASTGEAAEKTAEMEKASADFVKAAGDMAKAIEQVADKFEDDLTPNIVEASEEIETMVELARESPAAAEAMAAAYEAAFLRITEAAVTATGAIRTLIDTAKEADEAVN